MTIIFFRHVSGQEFVGEIDGPSIDWAKPNDRLVLKNARLLVTVVLPLQDGGQLRVVLQPLSNANSEVTSMYFCPSDILGGIYGRPQPSVLLAYSQDVMRTQNRVNPDSEGETK
jgi:hypothetical protein